MLSFDKDYIKSQFYKVAGHGEQANRTITLLLQKYAEQGKHYHTMGHIESMLRFLEGRTEEIKDWNSVALATFFHDAVYDSMAKVNEEQSATLLQSSLPDNSATSQAVQLILLTKKHTADIQIPDSGVFLDADLSVLGVSPQEYSRYAEQIRREYSWVDEITYRRERLKVLWGFLQRNSLFFTISARIALEEVARRNLMDEIQHLGYSTGEQRMNHAISDYPHHMPLIGGSGNKFDQQPFHVPLVGGSGKEFEEPIDDVGSMFHRDW